METGHYLNTVLNLLDAADIKKAFDANTKWDVIEIVSNRYLGGVAEPSQRAKMAESGRRILQFVADNDFKTHIPHPKVSHWKFYLNRQNDCRLWITG